MTQAEPESLDEPLVRIRGLHRTFDVSAPLFKRILSGQGRSVLRAVDGVDFEIQRGETFCLVGESGCGKSTIAKLVVGLLAPSDGHVELSGRTISGLSRRELGPSRRDLQMIFQDPYASLNPRWRVKRIVAEPLRAFGIVDGERGISERVARLLEQVGLSDSDGEKFPHEFSGGQRQRISIARALASEPQFLVCDEPTSALDVSVQAQILNLMKDLQDSLGLTYLFISHDLAVVSFMADRIGVMYLGRLVEVAPVQEIFDRPRHPYTRMLLETVPDLSMARRGMEPNIGEVPNSLQPPAGCAFHPRCPIANNRCRSETPVACATGPLSFAVCHAIEEGR